MQTSSLTTLLSFYRKEPLAHGLPVPWHRWALRLRLERAVQAEMPVGAVGQRAGRSQDGRTGQGPRPSRRAEPSPGPVQALPRWAGAHWPQSRGCQPGSAREGRGPGSRRGPQPASAEVVAGRPRAEGLRRCPMSHSACMHAPVRPPPQEALLLPTPARPRVTCPLTRSESRSACRNVCFCLF